MLIFLTPKCKCCKERKTLSEDIMLKFVNNKGKTIWLCGECVRLIGYLDYAEQLKVFRSLGITD